MLISYLTARKKSEVKSVHFLEPCKKAYVIEKKSPTLSIQNHPEIRCSKPIAKAGTYHCISEAASGA